MSITGLHEAMLASIPDDYQKSEGFITYDLTKAFALAVDSLDGDIETASDKFYVDNLTGDELTTFVKEHRGIIRKTGTYATATLKLISGSGTVTEGDLFSTPTGELFASTESKDLEAGDTWEVKAEAIGERYNVLSNTITKTAVTITGISNFTNEADASGGTDEEDDDSLRDRYKEDLLYPNNGSNKQAYIAWAESVSGVGRAKVFSQPGGVANSVEVCIVDSDYSAPDATIVAAVQEYIDPNNNGDGAGVAPLGAKCTVTGATDKSIAVSATVTLESGYSLEDVKNAFTTALTEYFATKAFKRTGVDTYDVKISYAYIGGLLLDVDGVSDYTDLLIDGGTSSITLGDRETPQVGTITLTSA